MIRGRANTYDFLRLLAALAVVVHHATDHLGVPFLWHEPGGSWWFYDGVPAFFIISGLFVYRSAEQLHGLAGGWRDFFVNRALRIIPALWVYLVFTVALVLVIGAATPGDLRTSGAALWIVTTLGLAPAYSPGFLDSFGAGHVNGSLWTIPVEVSFYVIVPLLVLFATRFGKRAFLVALGVVALASFAAFAIAPEGGIFKLLGITFVPYLLYFAVGIGWLFARHHVRFTGLRIAAAALAYLALQFEATGIPIAPRVLAVLALSYVIVGVGERGPRVFTAITRRIGDLSFGAYIWHMVVVNTFLWFGVTESLPGPMVVPSVLGLTLGLAFLSWRLVEKPALDRKRASSRGSAGRDLVPRSGAANAR